MTIVDVGRGTPVVLVPGIQGRWEWMQPAVDALSGRARVITFSLADEPTSNGRFDAARGFDAYVEQIGDAMTVAGVSSAVICGVSYGGLVAATFAARHPDRVAALVLVSAIPPDWQPDRRVRFYLHAPRLLAPLFCVLSLRMFREIAAAAPGTRAGIASAVRIGWRSATHLFSPVRMARRARLLEGLDLQSELSRFRSPVLIVTGEQELDRVVPPAATHRYQRVWPHATLATLERTGHLGSITRPGAFADLVMRFVTSIQAPVQRSKVG